MIQTRSFQWAIALVLFTLTAASAVRAELTNGPTIDDRVSTILFQDLNQLPIERNLFNMQTLGLTQGRAKAEPWSGSFWPMTEGSIANPYRLNRSAITDPEGEELSFPYGIEGSVDLYQFRNTNLLSRARELTREELDLLAPSEKYDLILGNADFSFTKKVWATIKDHQQRFGKIKSWEGSCHGWSTAAIRTPKPVRPIEVETAFGQKMTLFPDDVMALATYLYANSLFQDYIRLDGTSCNLKKPAVDRKTGRTINPQCEGTDPAVWHMTIVNMLGQRGESFVINRTNRDQVWNQPLVSYSYEYFNPMTGKAAPMNQALITRARYGNDDPYLDWRSPLATHIVGVKMTVIYSKEPALSPDTTDSENKLRELTYLYDLELDATGKIVGGEWRAVADGVRGWLSPKYAKYPGFIWTLPKQNAISVGDIIDENGELVRTAEFTWSGRGPMPLALIQAAAQGRDFEYKHWKYENGQPVVLPTGEWAVEYIEKKPQPSARIVELLLQMAR